MSLSSFKTAPTPSLLLFVWDGEKMYWQFNTLSNASANILTQNLNNLLSCFIVTYYIWNIDNVYITLHQYLLGACQNVILQRIEMEES